MEELNSFIFKKSIVQVDSIDDIEIINKDGKTFIYGKLYNTNALLKGLEFKWDNDNKYWYIDKKITKDEFEIYFNDYNNNRRNFKNKNKKKCEICNNIGHTYKNCKNATQKELLNKEINELEKKLQQKKRLLKKIED
tara:strand:+ start:81 stop:491 length:411 start_codon:yes stop_codon:yes gene_type:complete